MMRVLSIYGGFRQKVSHLRFAEYFKDGWVGVLEEGGQARACHPGRLGDVLFLLGDQVDRRRVQHVVPPGMLQVPDPVAEIAVVRDADQVPQVELAQPGLFLDFPQGGDPYVLTSFLMPFRQVPQAAPFDEQVVSPAVADQAAGGIDFLEAGTESPVAALRVPVRDVDLLQAVGDLEHPYEGIDVDFPAGMELHRVRVGERLVVGRADDDASFLKIDFAHYICIFAGQYAKLTLFFQTFSDG